jgi:hypothetical protein
MSENNRREFLGEVGQGMLVALIGPALAADMGFASQVAAEEPASKTPEGLERLIAMLQETPVPKLVPTLVGQLDKGTDLRSLVAAAALANVRAFAGQDYDGYHTFMALAPAYAMAQELPNKERALPIVKVLHRNSRLMGSGPNRKPDRLSPAEPAELKGDQPANKLLLEAARKHHIAEADRIYLAMAKGSLEQTYNDLQDIYHDELNVHRVVLAWRSWETIKFTGHDHARTLLRQTVRFCSDGDHGVGHTAVIREVLPRLMEKYRLMEKGIGKKEADDAWVERLSQVVFAEKQEQAAEAVAAALGEGFSPEVVGEAISLACARLVLSDSGRPKQYAQEKPVGSVHGDSIGVHASDAANAWRHIARVSNSRNTFASLIAGAFHTAGQSGRQMKEHFPLEADVEMIREKDATALLKLTGEAIRAKDQARASALAHCYGKQGHDARGLFNLLLQFAVSEDGALHAEKYYRTVSEEFASVRPAFRWRHLVALARVSASAYGKPAPGLDEARRLLG